MKLSSILAAMTIAICSTPAVLADSDWDTPSPQQVQFLAGVNPGAPAPINAIETAENRVENRLQWDMAELQMLEAQEQARCHDWNHGNVSAPYATPPLPTRTSSQNLGLPHATTAQYGYVAGGRGGLPSTSLDSFVRNAGGQAEIIYGDEGTTDIPPLFHFDTINSGIHGQEAAGLTTGHHSSLPSAWY